MQPRYTIARDHLLRAVTTLEGADRETRQIRQIIERTITLLDDFAMQAPVAAGNVLDLGAFRQRRLQLD